MTLSKSVGMDPNTAMAQMKRFTQSDGDAFLVGVVAAAVAGGANYCRVTFDSNGTVLDFDGRIYGEDLEEVFVAPFEGGPAGARELAIGLHNILASDPPGVTVESWSSGSGYRLRLEGGKQKFEKLTKCPWKENNAMNRVRVQTKKGWRPFGGLFGGGKSEELPPEGVALERYCRLANLKLEVNGNRISQSVSLGRCLVWVHVEAGSSSSPGAHLDVGDPDSLGKRMTHSKGNFSAVLGMGGDSSGPGLTLVVNGVSFSKSVPTLAEMGVRGVVAHPDLHVSDDRSEVLEDETYEELLINLEAEVMQMGGQLALQFNRMESLDRVEATEYIKYLIGAFRESGSLEEAESLCEQLLEGQHETLGDDDPEVAGTLLRLAELREELGRWEDAVPLYEQALEIFEDSRADQAMFARAKAGLAQIMYAAEEFDRAEQLAREALDLRKSALDPEDITLATSYELLARVYRAKYRYPARQFLEVKDLYANALKIFERQFGKVHPDVATLLQDTADYLRQQRKYGEAELLIQRALKIREEVLGPGDALVADTLDSLGTLYEDQGKSTQASEYYRKALEIWTELFGAEHPEVAQRLNNLVVLYRLYGRFAEAEPLYQRILDIREAALGRDHIDLVGDICNLALLYAAQAKYSKAEPLFARATDIIEKSLAGQPNHPDLAWILNHLGKLLDEQARFGEADSVLKRALAMWTTLLGPDHPDLAVSLDSLVRHYRVQKKYDQAQDFARQSLELKERTLGESHPETISSMATLAEMLRLGGDATGARELHVRAQTLRDRLGQQADEDWPLPDVQNEEQCRYTAAKVEAEKLHREAAGPAKQFHLYPEAEHLYLRALFAREQALGPNHPYIARTLDALANLYKTHRKFEAAEELSKRALELRKLALGDTHPDICSNLLLLIEIYLAKGLFSSAEPLAREWLALIELTLGDDHPQAAAALTHLAEIYGAAGNKPQQEEFYKQAMEIRHRSLGTEHPDFATSLADLLMVQENYEEASRLYAFVVGCLEESVGPEAVELIPVYDKYAQALKKLNRESLAVELETQAMVLRALHGLDFGD